MEHRIKTPAMSVIVARAGDDPFVGSTPIASRANGARVPAATEPTTVANILSATAAAAKGDPPRVVSTLAADAKARSTPETAAARTSRPSTRSPFCLSESSPVPRPHITVDDDWFPAFPAVPVSMVRKSARTRWRCKSASKRTRMTELTD